MLAAAAVAVAGAFMFDMPFWPWLFICELVALVSVVGLQELMRTSYIGANSTHHPFVFYMIAACVYLTITLTTQVGFDKIERLLQFRKKA